MKSVLHGVHVQAFADDVVVAVVGNTRNAIEQRAKNSLAKAEQWAAEMGVHFNMSKSKMLVMGRKYQGRSPTVILQGQTIKNEKQVKILGVVFDSGLSFLPHLNYVQEKVQKLNHKLAAFAGPDWGFTGQKLVDVYKKAIERIIVYAAPVWYSRHQHKLRKLRAMQRVSLLKITQSYRTAPNNSLNILAGVPPVHFIIEKECKMFKIQHEGEAFSWEGTEFKRDQITTKYDFWEQHPSAIMSIGYDTENVRETGIKIFTDGSASELGVGAAFVVIDESGRAIECSRLKLPTYSNNFEAEGIAILKAIEYIPKLNTGQRIQILTDSLSSLRALANSENRNTLINQIKLKFRALRGRFNIQFTYVKAHSGISGNELADTLAKEAVSIGTMLDTPISKQFINKELTKDILKKWNNIWNTENREAPLYQWIKNVKQIPEHFPTNYNTSQALTGHGRFPFYFYRFGITENNICRCGEAAENIDHYLEDCQLTEELRQELRQRHHGRTVQAKPEIIKNKASLQVLGTMVELINQKAT